MLSFKPAFSLSSFTFIKRFFSSSSLSAIRVVSSAYLSLLIFLPAILIPVYDSSSLAFRLWNYQPVKTNNSVPWGLLPSEMVHTLSMECVFPSVNLFFHSGWLLKSFLWGTRDPHMAALSRDSPETWGVTILLHPMFFLPKYCFHANQVVFCCQNHQQLTVHPG